MYGAASFGIVPIMNFAYGLAISSAQRVLTSAQRVPTKEAGVFDERQKLFRIQLNLTAAAARAYKQR